MNKNADTYLEIPEIAVIGMSHKSAPVEVRERFSFDTDKANSFMERLKESGIEELVYVSTCNRVELYFAATDIHKSFKKIYTLLTEIASPGPDVSRNQLYKLTGSEAVKHLFMVAASLDSMVIGENEISAQVKDSYSAAVDGNFTGVILNRLFHQAFSTSKRVRTETEISKNPLSVAFIASELAASVFADLSERSVLLVGAGEMGELILKYLAKSSIRDITIANRSLQNAERITQDINREARIIPLNDITLALPQSDIIIASASSKDFLITKEMLENSLEERGDKPLFVIDISVPRNVDPVCSGIKNVFLYNIDDMKKIAEENLKNRMLEAENADKIIEEDLYSFMDWYCELEIIPMITRINETFENVREAELKKFRRKKMKHLSDEDFKLVEELTENIMNKTLHNPIMAIKRYRAAKSHGYHDAESIREKTRIIRELFEK